MTKQRPHKQSSKKPNSKSRPDAFDGAIYFTVVFVGVVITLFGFLMTGGKNWAEFAVLYLAAIAVLMNFFALRAYQGAPLRGWRAAFARLPLRPAGFGTKQGRPLDAAHQSGTARSAVLISVALSVLLIVVVAVLLIPGIL